MDSKIGTRLHGRVHLSLASIDAYLRASLGKTDDGVPRVRIKKNQCQFAIESNDSKNFARKYFMISAGRTYRRQFGSKLDCQPQTRRSHHRSCAKNPHCRPFPTDGKKLEEYLERLFMHIFARLAK